MSGKRFQARAKTVQKLGHDGLVEKNMATGEEKRVSQRTADISFGPARPQEQAAVHRAVQRGGGAPKKKRRKQPRPVQQTAVEAAHASPPEPEAPPPIPEVPSMRMAADAPMVAPAVTSEDVPPPDPASRERRRKRSKQRQTAKHTPDAAHSLDDRPMRNAGDAPMVDRPPVKDREPPAKRPPRPVEGGGRLKFGEADGEKPVSDGVRFAETKARTKKQQAQRFAPDAAQPADTSEQRSSRLVEDGGGRLKFERAADNAAPVPGGGSSEASKQTIKKHQVMDHAAGSAQPTTTSEQRSSRLVEDGGGRLRSERAADDVAPVPGKGPSEGSKQTVKRRQGADHAAGTAQPADTSEQRPSRLVEDGGGRLKFERAAGDVERVSGGGPSKSSKQTVKRRQITDHAAGTAQPTASQQTELPVHAGGEANTHQRDSPQQDPKAPKPSAMPEDRAAYKKRQAAKFAANPTAPVSGRGQRLRFEDEPPKADSAPVPPQSPPSTSDPASVPKEDAPPPSRKYEKAVRRVERTERKVEQARAGLPTKRRLSIQPEPGSETGKLRRRLHFEQEVLPEYRPPSLPARIGGTVKTAAVMKLHSKIHENERDNVAVEASHKSELFVEQGVGRALRWEQSRRRSKPYRALRYAERRAAKAKADLAWQTALQDTPELRDKNILMKWIQKRKIKRKYAQAAHQAKRTAQTAQTIVNTNSQIVRAVQQYAAAHKSLLAAVALLAMVVMFFAAGMTACTTMLSGFQSSYISASYMANEQDICDSDLYYTELETDLQIDINDTEANYPGYDEYRYNIGEISHDPYELMGYLSTVFNAFTFEEVKAEIERLFGEQYQLTREAIIETRYDSDGDPYDWHVLKTTLTVTPLSTIISNSLTPGEQADRYSVYMQTLGNRQAFGNPFDFPWLGYVSSGYGYRVHPVSGAKDLHRGVDIAVAQGTPIKAVHDGRVISAGDAGGYGLCVVIEDEKGYQSRYAHCASLSVSVGQEVERGDVIAAVGSTGNSTGPHLHLEVMLDGEYLDPYYFVDTGGGPLPGTPAEPVIPDYSGEPMGDGSYAAMLAEAEKYLGSPYLWGGSSPSTSFDCSGFVSWVINQSGVGSVGRQTATGLYNLCTPVSMADARPGDLIFFSKTYSTPKPVSHVGIYVGNGQMIHCGDPIAYANINSRYWRDHYFGMGRLP